MILAIDPGPKECGVVVYSVGHRIPWPSCSRVVPTELLLTGLLSRVLPAPDSVAEIGPGTQVVIEMMASYGMTVGADVFETCVVIGRLMAACEPWAPVARLFRRDVKLHLCGSARAKDGNVRQALIDKFGGKEKAIGKKADPGPLYGVKSHCWAALALAVTFAETRQTQTTGETR